MTDSYIVCNGAAIVNNIQPNIPIEVTVWTSDTNGKVTIADTRILLPGTGHYYKDGIAQITISGVSYTRIKTPSALPCLGTQPCEYFSITDSGGNPLLTSKQCTGYLLP